MTLAPFFWMNVAPVAIYNVALLAAMALSAYTMFLLGRRLTGSATAGFVAGVIYGYAPYRFEHYTHLELQIVFWIPLAMWTTSFCMAVCTRQKSSLRCADGCETEATCR